jgi:DEAD/DEAH box helicase domain-containing protein
MPLDQYLASDPEQIVGAPVEHARIDPDNVEILVQHLKCAAFELPFEDGDAFGDVPAEAVSDALGFLAKHEVLHPAPGASGNTVYHWATDAYPANAVSLRSLSWDNFVIIDVETDKNIAEMDWRSTHTMLHEQAIYQHAAEQWQVERLDFENHKAFVRKVKPDYYTTAMTHTNVSVYEEEDADFLKLAGDVGVEPRRRTFGVAAGTGEVSVVERVVGYKKIKYHTHENVGYGDVHLPEMQMHTTSIWLTFPEELVLSFGLPRAAVVDALRGLANAMHTVAAVGLMTDPRDLGHCLGDRKEEGGTPDKAPGEGPGFDPTIFIYDHIPGGVGLAPRLWVERETLLRRTRRLVESCACEVGCPACIGPEAGIGVVQAGPAQKKPAARKALALDVLEAIGVTAIH